MKLIQLDISAIRASDSQNNAYVLLLSEITGKRQLPIVIGWCEARSIAIALDGSEEPERPLTHDLFKTFSNSFNITISKVIIHTLTDGIFHSSFFCKDQNNKELEIDARTSDAIAIAIRFSCPVFTYEDILKKAGIIVGDHKENISVKEKKKKHNLESYSLKDLKKLLDESVDNENYEYASKIRDEINKRKNK